jgi:hypothetical protein
MLQRYGSSPRLILIEASDLGTAFYSPTATVRFRTTAAGSTLPAYPFDCFAEIVSNPFDIRLPSSRAISGSGEDQHRTSVVRFSSFSNPRLTSGLATPLRVFQPSGSKYSKPFPVREACLGSPSDLRSLPDSAIIELSTLPDHRFRSASYCQARCSVNLLEPTS